MEELKVESSQTMNNRFPKSADFLVKWLKFRSHNQFIEDVNIIPFKCPLKAKYNTFLTKEERFPFKTVYDFSIDSKKPITDVFDLTFTNKYYTPYQEESFPDDVTHHKFMIPGKRVPEEKVLNEILNKMDDIIKSGGVIGIHCTHGINRTGFIICTYLVTRLKYEPDAAISAFNKARGSELEHGEYIDAVLALKNL